MASADIIRKNLGLMVRTEEGSMQKYLMKAGLEGATTIGKGENGKPKKYATTGANFYYDLSTGEIVLFSNLDARYHKAEGFGMGHFQLVVDDPNNRTYEYEFFMILSVTYDLLLETVPMAKKIIEASMENYNRVACVKSKVA